MYVYLYPHLCVYMSLKFKLFFIFPQILTVFQQMQFVEGFLKWKKKPQQKHHSQQKGILWSFSHLKAVRNDF